MSLLWYRELLSAEIWLASCVSDVTLSVSVRAERLPFCGGGYSGVVALSVALGVVLCCYR